MFERTYNLLNGDTFYLKIRRNVAVIEGDSASGKSYIISQIKTLQAGNDIPGSTCNFEEFFILNTEESILFFLGIEIKGKIIVIDRYDYFVKKYPELLNKITQVCSSNYLVICGRGYIPHITRNNDYGVLEYNAAKKQFYIRYIYSMDSLLNESE